MRAACQKGLSALALTDHDTMDGIAEAQAAADECGLRLIPGVELEIDWLPASGGGGALLPATKEFHLLGLDIASPSASFLEMITELKQAREDRNLSMIQKMRDLGMDADYEEIKTLSNGCVGRPHFAKYLIQHKIAKNIDQAFKIFLGTDKPLYISKAGVDFKRAMTAIKESGGVAVLAHPSTLYVSWGRLPDIIASLKAEGLDGIEAWHPLVTRHTAQRLEALGRRLGLRISAGSDYHGEARRDRSLGHTSDGIKIDDKFLAVLARD